MKCNEPTIIGWDIGGANIKAVRTQWKGRQLKSIQTAVRSFEIWREPQHLAAVLLNIAEKLEMQEKQDLAVTMTAELSDVFRTKREGVLYVLDAVEQAFGEANIYLFTLDGTFVRPERMRQNPLSGAATNWLASALLIADYHPDCILIDIGSTTTDIIPIRNGKPINIGQTDTQRLISGELVYTGVTRTNPNTFASQAPVQGCLCRVAAEYFTAMADVYLILGRITSDQYSCPTADGRGKTVSAARERLARFVCSDADLMSANEIHTLASYLQEKQLQQIVEAIFQVMSGSLQDDVLLPLVVVGSGKFLTEEAARRLNLQVIEFDREWNEKVLTAFPAMAVTYLLSKEWLPA
ncbi:hydantoinase/oxoprolinase family protein [Desulfococcaceae bacterium HSG7]|nr:hydantoinase/oxoprolinase family protein [Desulfococcaceae bacterium HSG7]